MSRYPLQSVIALGLLITAISGAGVVAVFTDTATTGPSDVTSGERPRAADLQIATADAGPGPIVCDTFSDELQTGLFSLGDVQPDEPTSVRLCLRNVGVSSVTVTATALDLVDSETSCTGDEEAFGDTTCGGGLGGELSDALTTTFQQADCETGTPATASHSSNLAYLGGASSEPLFAGPLDPGDTGCLYILVSIFTYDSSETLIQVAQSDQVKWRFAFDATT